MSIIADALSKAKKDRDRAKRPEEVIASEKIQVPVKEIFESQARLASEPSSVGGREVIASRVSPPARKTLVISVIFLLAVFVFLAVFNQFFMPSSGVVKVTARDTSDESAVSVSEVSGTSAEAEAYSDVKSEFVVIERREGIIDKMSQALKGNSAKDEFFANFTLSGIVYDAQESWAIVNNKVMRSGDELGGARIISIAPEKVVFLFRNEKLDLGVK
ncbi:MAG: hypothetical protein ISS26_06420 [Candidatus Omnitrophica bacterium]|nr:hypothetical protein [Candidatus Omnitrophota bacterium]